jgi:NADPH:quinone reductase-like Zn-dependent oxidoreductase
MTSATCGPSNIEFVRSLGADHVIDYSSKEFMAGLDRYDVIFDAVGKSSFVNCRPLLAPGGTYVTTLPTPSLFFWSGVQSIAGIFGKAKRAKGILVQPSGKDLAILCQLAERGQAQAHSEPDILPLSRGRGA